MERVIGCVVDDDDTNSTNEGIYLDINTPEDLDTTSVNLHLVQKENILNHQKIPFGADQLQKFRDKVFKAT